MTLSKTSMQRAEFELSEGGSVICVDFRSIAGLVDAVLGADPARLTTLFNVVWETDYRLESRAVLKVAVSCRDPLSDLGNLCKDALRTLTDLELLATTGHPWISPSEVLAHQAPRMNALLNACDAEIQKAKTHQKAAMYEVIRERLVQAAAAERRVREREIRLLANLRQSRVPELWQVLEYWRDKK